MAGFDIYFDALEECAGRANGVEKQFKAMADEAPDSAAGSLFGSMKDDVSGEDVSGKLTQAVKDLEAKIKTETRHAENNLDKVEVAVHKVIENVRKADLPVVPRTEQA
ncbi:hypothetical protein AB0B45_41200 [Nonomuraea sp. NPDC049152]|uniref:hypothetical protein n=1 Tax=Nonomuraea sp. NPDC049152 TaxID=3154350 RepID=UPI0033D67372